ncbi:MAG: hypothetical protein ACFFD4_38145 [Candidatus Odinarchaeota archaeon]
MGDAFTSWLNLILKPLVDAYGTMLEGFPLNIFSYIISAILLALFMQAVFAIFPPLKSIVDTIMAPFRIIHIWLHMQAAREIIEKRQKKGDLENFSLSFTSFFGTGFGTKAETPAIALSGICSPKEASRIANAPLKGTLVLLLMLTLLTPFLRTTFVGKIIHLYLFIGIATASFPSGSDYKFTYNMLLLQTRLNFQWLLLPAAGFSSAFIIIMVLTENVVFAIIWGIAMTTFSTWALLMVIMKRTGEKSFVSPDELHPGYSSSGGSLSTVYSDTNAIETVNYVYQLEMDH